MASINFFEQNMLGSVLPYFLMLLCSGIHYSASLSHLFLKKEKKRYVLTEVLLEMFMQSITFLH